MKRFLQTLVLSLLCFGFSGSLTDAGTDYFTVNIYFDSATEDVNAFESSFVYPSSWTVTNINLKDSDLIYWIQTPQKNLRGAIPFSGIFPGGVQNLKDYASPLQLFSVEFAGDLNTSEAPFLKDSTIYLNHPMALKAQQASMSYEVSTTVSSQKADDLAALDHLNYEFTADPVTGQKALVVNSYRGALAAYSFKLREGDFGRGLWSNVDGVTLLSDPASTIELFITSPSGEETKIVLRSSTVRYGLIGFALLIGTCFIIYLFLRVFRAFREEDVTANIRVRERTKLT